MDAFQQIKLSIVRGFFAHKVISVDLGEGFLLASGKRAPVYLDHRRIFSDPVLREEVTTYWVYTLREHVVGPHGDLVFAGTATAGIAPAYALAEAFGAGFIYVRAKSKEHGLGRLIEGSFGGRTKVIVVDDMVTTGGSLLAAVESLRAECGSSIEILCATSISSHGLPDSRRAFEASGTKLVSLFTTREIFDTALTLKLLSSSEHERAVAWLEAQGNKSATPAG